MSDELQFRIKEQHRAIKEARIATQLLRHAPRWMRGSAGVPFRYTAGRWLSDAGTVASNSALFARGSLPAKSKLGPLLDRVAQTGTQMNRFGAHQLTQADSLGRKANLKGWNAINPLEWGRGIGRHYVGIGASAAAMGVPWVGTALWGPSILANPVHPLNLFYAGSMLPKTSGNVATNALLRAQKNQRAIPSAPVMAYRHPQSYPRRIA